MILYLADEDWRDEAACIGEPPEAFFPTSSAVAAGLKLCASCPVRSQCLEVGMRSPMLDHGIWGGRTPAQRYAIRRARYRARAIAETQAENQRRLTYTRVG